MLVFVEGRKPVIPDKSPQSRERTNNKLGPRDTGYGNGTWVTAMGGEHMHMPLCHPVLP